MESTEKRTSAVNAVAPAVGTPETVAPEKPRGSSRATRTASRVEFRATKALSRVTAAVDKGMARYVRRRDASDLKKKDGALIDLPENVLRVAAKTVADAAPALGDVTKLVYSKKSRKAMRRMMRALPSIPYFY